MFLGLGLTIVDPVRPSGAGGPSVPAWVLTSGASVATMDIDFVNDRAWNDEAEVSIASLLACSRADAGFYTNAAGTLTSIAANTLRTGTNGLLVEEARTNVCFQSQTFGTTWSANGITVGSDATAAPDGTTTADSLTATATATATRSVTGNASTLTNGVSYTMSVYAKQIVGGTGVLQIVAGSAGFGANAWGNFDLTNGVVGTMGSAVTGSSITALANGWYRCSIIMPSTATSASATAFSLQVSTTATRLQTANMTAGQGLYLWGAQQEIGAQRSSYIPTTTAAVSRAADVVTFSDLTWADGATQTLYAEWRTRNTNNAVVWAFDATNDKALDEQTGMSARIAGATVANTVAADATAKAAARMVVNDFAISMNGGTVVGDTSETAPGTHTASRLGLSLAGANALNSYIRRVAMFGGVAVNDAGLVTLST